MPDDANSETLKESAPVPDEADEEPDSGVEPEQDDPNETKIEHPFDPEKIKVRPVNIVVEQLISRIRHDEIDLAPDFQRLRGIWDKDRKSRLVESLLLRIPLPVFYVAADHDENWSVVDGLQRISTIDEYVGNKFDLRKLQYLSHLDGKRHEDLPRAMQRRINETQLAVNVVEPGTPEEVMIDIFRRINTGGMMLNEQEIRHAVNPGPIREYLKKLTETEEFRKATGRSINPKRMDDRDCVLRFLAFHIDGWENYKANDIDGYLDSAMKRINRITDREELDSITASITADFRKAMGAAADIFGEDAFRKRYPNNPRRHPINKALFGAWTVGLARRSRKKIDRLVRNRERVLEGFSALLEDDREFERAISYSTSAPARVRKQFQTIDDLIERCL